MVFRSDKLLTIISYTQSAANCAYGSESVVFYVCVPGELNLVILVSATEVDQARSATSPFLRAILKYVSLS